MSQNDNYGRYQCIYNQNQFHNKMSEHKQIVINMPDVNSTKYKMNLREIEESVRSLNNFTDNLQEKVNTMLKGQETEFVNSYKNHMSTVQRALKDYEERISQYQKKIEYYQNEGVLSTLLNKINFLQTHERKLLDKLDKKDRVIFDLKHQISTQKNQIKSLHQRIKELLVNSEPIKKMRQSSFREGKESQPTFTTQIPIIEKSILKSNQSMERISSTQMKYHTLVNPETPPEWKNQLNRARNQIQIMKKRNRQLSSVNSKILDKVGQVDQFFLKIINQLKRKIGIRKQFKQCSFEDFKQEDKLELLVKVLSNDEVLHHLYQKIFHKTSFLPLSGIASSSLDVSPKNHLPTISTARRP